MPFLIIFVIAVVNDTFAHFDSSRPSPGAGSYHARSKIGERVTSFQDELLIERDPEHISSHSYRIELKELAPSDDDKKLPFRYQYVDDEQVLEGNPSCQSLSLSLFLSLSQIFNKWKT